MSSFREKISETSKTYSSKSYKTIQDSQLTCHNCKNSKEELETQIAQLKDKAHQSFMQVLQIQQLHDEELTLIRQEFQEKEDQYRQEISGLKQQVQALKTQLTLLQKNVKRHSYDFDTRQLIIDNIDAILCQQGQNSYLDESQLLQFKDLISTKNGNDYVLSLRREIYKDFKFVSNNKTQIQKLFILIRELKEENLMLVQKNEEGARKVALLENQVKIAKNGNECLNKEVKFISEQVKRLGNDKLKLEKKVSELERARSAEEGSSSPKIFQFNRIAIKSHSPNSRTDTEMEKSISMLEVSKYSQLSQTKREINQLNYAKFMAMDDGQPQLHNFKKRSLHIQDRE